MMAGKGTIKLTNNITLKSVLHVPKLACNLLFVSKLSKDSNYRIIFFKSHCIFHDQTSGRIFGHARMLDGLYYFNGPSIGNKKNPGL